MKIGIIIQSKEPEKVKNAFHFAITIKEKGCAVKVFFMGDALDNERLIHDSFSTEKQLKNFIMSGGEILTCGYCFKLKQMDSSESCLVSTKDDCANVIIWADKVVTFS